MWPFKKPHRRSNEWLETDRRERAKLIAATLAIVFAVLAGIALLVYALVEHHG